jgi:hypothetical protein
MPKNEKTCTSRAAGKRQAGAQRASRGPCAFAWFAGGARAPRASGAHATGRAPQPTPPLRAVCPPHPPTDLYYKRVGDFKFTGEAFPDNAFTGATIHEGYAGAFAKLWPDVQAVLKEQVVSADKKAAPKSITFSGHSLGGNMAQLLGFAVRAAPGRVQRSLGQARSGPPAAAAVPRLAGSVPGRQASGAWPCRRGAAARCPQLPHAHAPLRKALHPLPGPPPPARLRRPSRPAKRAACRSA